MSRSSFLELSDLTVSDFDRIITAAEAPPTPGLLAGSSVAMVFEKPSNRTRNSTEMAVVHLGGHALYIAGHEVDMGTRESPADVARTLACYHQYLAVRVKAHGTLTEMDQALTDAGADVGVINLLSDYSHPCQGLADLLTIRECLAPRTSDPEALLGRRAAWIGDANNVARSFIEACLFAGLEVRVAAPDGYGFSAGELARLSALSARAGRGGQVVAVDDPKSAADGAQVVSTDVWVSMGQDAEAEARQVAFADFQVNDALMAQADAGAIVLHCLPAHRGLEITASVLDGPQSVVWRQAYHRLSAMVGLFTWLEDQR